MGKVLTSSRAMTTGRRATAEYRLTLCRVINSPTTSCQRQAPGGSQKRFFCSTNRLSRITQATPERINTASSSPVPLSKASRADTWLAANMVATHIISRMAR